MSSFDCYLGSKDYEGWQTLCELYCTIWDEDESVSHCRFCEQPFSKARRHHCRQCGGIYCTYCAPLNILDFQTALNAFDDRDEWWVGKKAGRPNPKRRVSDADSLIPDVKEEDKGWYPGKMLGRKKSEEESEKWFPGKFLGVKQKKKDASEESSSDQNAGTEKQVEEDNEDTESGRKCFGCRYGETPGERVQILLKDAYYTVRENRAKLAKNPVPFGQAKLYKLERGSMYGTGKRKAMVREDGGIAHVAGYFELLNKSEFACGVRVFQAESEPLREASLPTYTALLPGAVVYMEYDPMEVAGLCVSFICLNRVATFSDADGNAQAIIDTRRDDRSVETNISPAHVISNFTEISIYEFDCGGKNCIVKYQGNGVAELRKLSTTAVAKSGVHMMKSVIKKDKERDETTPSHLDTSTNTENMKCIFSTLR